MFSALLMGLFVTPIPVLGMEVAPHISDRKIVERLTRLEEGQAGLREELKQSRADMDARFTSIDARFTSIDARFTSMDAQFDRLWNMMLGILAAFTALTGCTISLIIWDRRTAIRPFETKVRSIEEAFSDNRLQVLALVEAMRRLGQRDERVAEVLKEFHLL